MTAPVASVDDVERTGRIATTAQWAIAGVVMSGSMAAGGFAFHYLHENWALGVVTALAVDLALAAWLLISRRLRAVGIKSPAGVVLEVAAGGMTMFLNIGAAAFRDGVSPHTASALLAVAHSFLPVMLVLVSFAGGDAQHKLMKLRREREAAEQAEREAQAARQRAELDAQQRERERKEIDRAKGVLVDADDYYKAADEKRRLGAASVAEEQRALRELDMLRAEREQRQAAEHAAREAEKAAAKAVAQRATQQPKTATTASRKKTAAPASSDAIRQWIREQLADGQPVTAAAVVKFNGEHRRGDEAKLIRQVKAEIADMRIDSELAQILNGGN